MWTPLANACSRMRVYHVFKCSLRCTSSIRIFQRPCAASEAAFQELTTDTEKRICMPLTWTSAWDTFIIIINKILICAIILLQKTRSWATQPAWHPNIANIRRFVVPTLASGTHSNQNVTFTEIKETHPRPAAPKYCSAPCSLLLWQPPTPRWASLKNRGLI